MMIAKKNNFRHCFSMADEARNSGSKTIGYNKSTQEKCILQ